MILHGDILWVTLPICPTTRERDDTGEAEDRGAEKKCREESEGQRSQLEARAVGLKVICPVCKMQLAIHNQLIDHYTSKHPKERPPSNSE
ncbi:zinc finger 706-like [Olea europaea subsp. europaea]|uniref:Zinc finger 706-like n=1 Tax=Olea europaea subsp. europaea TaxID=158383 RepID=A0A8S0RUB7_OLEEU|nr:zinc finger 706-like [Olea europaea subsp. europaea]